MSSLKKLIIEHLRGSVLPFSLPFERGRKLTVVYGENGTGKSTICDALEFLGKGRVGSLDNRGLGKTNPYWHSVGKKPSEVSVSLETSSGTCRATIHKSDVVAAPPELRPRVEVLRRSQILSLVEAKPAERYAAIKRFIDVTPIESSEDNLRSLIRDNERGRDVAVARVAENREAIRQFWEEAGKPGTDPFQWAETEVQRDESALQLESAALSALQGAYAALNAIPEQLRSAEANLQLANEALNRAGEELGQLVTNVADDAADVVSILETASAYLHRHPEPGICPLCESPDKVEGLAERVKERVQEFTALQQALASKKRCDEGVARAGQQLEMVQVQAMQHAERFNTCLNSADLPQDAPKPNEPLPANTSEWGAWLVTTGALPMEWKGAETSRYDRRQFLGTLKRALQTYNENRDAQRELDVLLPKLRTALNVVEDERKRFTDEMLKNIAAEVGRLYEAVHPGEGLNKISLILDPAKRASLEIGASFCGNHNTPPQAYFSDSHLDTLGLCVFLALAALDNPDQTILALDDVLASVDEPHVDRLIEMLYTEAERFRHCLITTHYRPWKQKLRWGWLQNGHCQFVELTRWTSANGLTLIRSVPDLERLQQLLKESPPDPQLVCAKAGVILEAALDFLTQHYECLVPRRAGGYTLGDLLPAIDKKLRTALVIEVKSDDGAGNVVYTSVPLGPYLDELTRIAQTRNVFGCHFNELSFDLLDADALGFGQQVLELMSVLTDREAGWPKSGKSGSYWQTTGETRRLHPFRRPT